MNGTGPEALLVRGRVEPAAELAEYVRLEYPAMRILAFEAMLERERDLVPAEAAAFEPPRPRGRHPVRREDVPLGAGPAAWSPEGEGLARSGARARAVLGTILAALPAFRGDLGVDGVGVPICSAPIFGQASR